MVLEAISQFWRSVEKSERANYSTITDMAEQLETLSDRSMVVVLAVLLPEDSSTAAVPFVRHANTVA